MGTNFYLMSNSMKLFRVNFSVEKIMELQMSNMNL